MALLSCERAATAAERGTRGSLAILLLLALVCASTAQGQTQVSEVDLKSAFLYKFIHYAEWPPEALGDLEDPIAICVIEQDELAQVLEGAVQGRTSHERPVVVRRVDGSDPFNGCHVLFVGAMRRLADGPGDRARVGATDPHRRRCRGVRAPRRHDQLHPARHAPGLRDQPGSRAAGGSRSQFPAAQAGRAGAGRERRRLVDALLPGHTDQAEADCDLAALERRCAAVGLGWLRRVRARGLSRGDAEPGHQRRRCDRGQQLLGAQLRRPRGRSADAFGPASRAHGRGVPCIYRADERLFAAYYNDGAAAAVRRTTTARGRSARATGSTYRCRSSPKGTRSARS